MDEDDDKGFTPSSLMGCAVAGLPFLWLFALAGMASGMSCRPEIPCWTDNRVDLAMVFVLALLSGAGGGWVTTKLIRWVNRRLRS
jgi:hypothetical protein